MLVLAGAGSGKTRVLVHRIAWLVERCRISPYEVLAVTFTNKAASEMRNRTEQLLDFPIGSMWIGTFHGLANRLLRIHWKEAGLPQAFEVIDAPDQVRLVKRIVKEADLDDKDYSARDIAQAINKWKDEGMRPHHIVVEEDSPRQQKLLDLYERYEELTRENGLVDFAELLLRSHELWLEDKNLLTRYQQRFRHILVDEFQDTNRIQFAWVKMLAGDANYVMAVGDDDQSIYGWRGAQVSNIWEFQKHYADVQILRLEQNYRSTQTILNAANTLIKNNPSRLEKTLWTQAGAGEPIRIFNAHTEFDEANYVAEKCQDWLGEQAYSANEIAILYRNNAQSRVLEQVFSERSIPYRIYGGPRFYERTEIRNVLAYMKLMHDPHSDVAVERVVNTPSRGIGAKTMESVRETAERNNSSLWDGIRAELDVGSLTGRAKNSLRAFVDLVEGMSEASRDRSLDEVARIAVRDSGLWDYHGKEKGESGRARRENMDELVNACAQFQGPTVLPLDSAGNATTKSDEEKLRDFLDQAMLDAGEYQSSDQEAINMMTLHSAKGLEFPIVFIVGLEEDLFPHISAINDYKAEEEERRLAYVGITRSMRQLFLTHSSSRSRFGMQRERRLPSRFLKELPKEGTTHVRRAQHEPLLSPNTRNTFERSRNASGSPSRKRTKSPFRQMSQSAASPWQLGSEVVHSKFGTGTILDTRGGGSGLQLQIEFRDVGRKWFMANTPHLSMGTQS